MQSFAVLISQFFAHNRTQSSVEIDKCKVDNSSTIRQIIIFKSFFFFFVENMDFGLSGLKRKGTSQLFINTQFRRLHLWSHRNALMLTGSLHIWKSRVQTLHKLKTFGVSWNGKYSKEDPELMTLSQFCKFAAIKFKMSCYFFFLLNWCISLN